MKREAELKAAFTKVFKAAAPHYLVLLHASRAAPDRSITGNRRTTFWEFKHATPLIESSGDQKLMCKRLAAHGFYCRYVVWFEYRDQQATLIVHPDIIGSINDRVPRVEATCEGFDHKWLTDYILTIHRQFPSR